MSRKKIPPWPNRRSTPHPFDNHSAEPTRPGDTATKRQDQSNHIYKSQGNPKARTQPTVRTHTNPPKNTATYPPIASGRQPASASPQANPSNLKQTPKYLPKYSHNISPQPQGRTVAFDYSSRVRNAMVGSDINPDYDPFDVNEHLWRRPPIRPKKNRVKIVYRFPKVATNSPQTTRKPQPTEFSRKLVSRTQALSSPEHYPKHLPQKPLQQDCPTPPQPSNLEAPLPLKLIPEDCIPPSDLPSSPKSPVNPPKASDPVEPHHLIEMQPAFPSFSHGLSPLIAPPNPHSTAPQPTASPDATSRAAPKHNPTTANQNYFEKHISLDPPLAVLPSDPTRANQNFFAMERKRIETATQLKSWHLHANNQDPTTSDRNHFYIQESGKNITRAVLNHDPTTSDQNFFKEVSASTGKAS